MSVYIVSKFNKSQKRLTDPPNFLVAILTLRQGRLSIKLKVLPGKNVFNIRNVIKWLQKNYAKYCDTIAKKKLPLTAKKTRCLQNVQGLFLKMVLSQRILIIKEKDISTASSPCSYFQSLQMI